MWKIFLVLLSVISTDAYQMCIGYPGKCPTYLYELSREAFINDDTLKPIQTIQSIGSNLLCLNHCYQNVDCFMSTWNKTSGLCSLYNRTSFTYKSGTGLIISPLKCCNFSECRVDFPNRCPGNVVTYPGVPATIYNQHRAIPIPDVTDNTEQCYKTCLLNPTYSRICLSVTYYRENLSSCDMNYPWDVNQLNLIPFDKFIRNDSAWTMVWSCCDNVATPDNNDCRKLSSKPTWPPGKWQKRQSSQLIDVHSTPILHAFKTLDINTCLTECESQTFCAGGIWFNQSTSTCILECQKGSPLNACPENFIVKSRFLVGTFWQWSRCHKYHPSVKESKSNVTKRSSCLCVNHFELVHLVYDHCGQPNITNTYTGLVNGSAFTLTGEEVQLNKTDLWLRVDNGFQFLWLKSELTNGTISCEEIFCHICNANQHGKQNLRILSRSTGWFANSIKYVNEYRPYYTSRPSTIVINFSGGTFNPCYTTDCAAFYAQYFQIFHWQDGFDCGPNFYINPNGLVLEGAGAMHAGHMRRCEQCHKNFQDIFSLQVIGNFTITWPADTIVETLKSFIQYAIRQNWIFNGHYKLERWNQHKISKLYIATAAWPSTNSAIAASGRKFESHADCPLTYLKYFSLLLVLPCVIGLLYLGLYRARLVGHATFCHYMLQLSRKNSVTILQVNNNTSSCCSDISPGNTNSLEYFECHCPAEIFVIVDKTVIQSSPQTVQNFNHYAIYYLNYLSNRGADFMNLRKFCHTLEESEMMKCCPITTQIFILFEENNPLNFSLIICHLHEEESEGRSIISRLKCCACFCDLSVYKHSLEETIQNRITDVISREIVENSNHQLNQWRNSIILQQQQSILTNRFAHHPDNSSDNRYNLVYLSENQPLITGSL